MKLYKSVILGLAAFSFAGCFTAESKNKPNEPPLVVVRSQTEKSDLENGVTDALTRIKRRLSQREMVVSQYSRYIFDEFKQAGVVDGAYDEIDNLIIAGHLTYAVNLKLGIRKVDGLHSDYYVLKGLSVEAEQDKNSYVQLKRGVGSELERDLGRRASARDFCQILNKATSSIEVSSTRRNDLVRDLVQLYGPQHGISQTEPCVFPVQKIDAVLNVIKGSKI